MRVQELIPAPGWSAGVARRNVNNEISFEVHPLIGWALDDDGQVVPLVWSPALAEICYGPGVVKTINPVEFQTDAYVGLGCIVLEPGQTLTDELKQSLRSDIAWRATQKAVA